MSQLALAIEDVDRHENHANLEACQIQIDDLQAIGQVNAEPVAGFQAALRQQLRQTITARVDIAKRVAVALEFKRRMVAAADEGKIKEMKEIQKPKIPRQPALRIEVTPCLPLS